ncbi:APC family permease [Cryobacterium frigoriphilum]|uniref:APC family permease n=1 Tax=Cryobacterium frigoriphilum TaxID=1259150 RepID=A0A4R9A779_9MICO|nr:APC family permease [Cryobacterium frigoriphilum]TFD53454.1 APC family permease [Cryobacterium frigoriphilum]
MSTPAPTLKRHLGTGRATIVGLSAMIGAGVFYVWAPAAAVAGSGLLIGLVIAAVIASLNALSSTQLAMAHPVSGGAYAFGRRYLGPWWGFTAGWMFMAGKTASAGAIALIAGSYLWPDYARAVAVAAVVVFAAVNMAGIRSTAWVSFVIVFVVLGGLAVLLAVVGFSGSAARGPLDPGTMTDAGAPAILQAAGLLFFCFAGYARMATLGEEVRDPQKTLPRAILTALGVTLALYFAIGLLCVTVLGPERLAASVSPLADLLDAAATGGGAGGGVGGDAAAGGSWAVVARVVAAVACLGSLMGILAGLSRTGLAMARERDLPGPLGRISARTHAPVVAEASVAVVAIAGILLLGPTQMVGFSACTVLVYYAIAHLSAMRQPVAERWLPRALPVVGLIGCLVLAVNLPWPGVVAAAAWLAIGLAARGIRLRLSARP